MKPVSKRSTAEHDPSVMNTSESRPALEQTISAQGASILAATITATVREPLLILTDDLRVLIASTAFYETFKISPEETEAQCFCDMGNGSWDIPALRSIFEQMGSAATACHDVEIKHTFPAVGHKTLLVNVRYVVVAPSQVSLIIVAIEDISERRQAETQRQEREEAARFLAETRTILSSALDVHTLCSAITSLVVPRIADCCAVDIFNDTGGCDSVAVAHTKPEKVALVKAYREAHPIAMQAPHGLPEVVRTKTPKRIPVIPDDVLGALAETEQDVELLRRLGITAAMNVPILQRGAAIGAITFVNTESRKQFTEADVVIAEGLARHAGLAIENARLFATVQHELAARKQAEIEATLAQEHLYTLFMQAPVAIAILTGSQYTVELANPLACQLWGRGHDEVIAKPLLEAIPELTTQGIPKILEQVITTGARHVAEELPIHLQRNDNQEPLESLYFNIIYEPMRDATGAVTRVMVLATGVSEHVRARQRIAESEARWRFLAETMPQKIFTAKPNGEVDYFNPQWVEFTGLSFEEIKNWGWVQFIHPDDVAENVRRWDHALDTGEPFQCEHRFRRTDGIYRWHLSRAHPMHDAAGTIIMWIGSNTDIDDIKHAEHALSYQSYITNIITSNATLALFMMDDQQHCTFMNPTAERMTGFTFADVQVLNRPLHDIIHHLRPDGTHYPLSECPIDRALPTKSQETGADIFVHKDGTFYPVAFTASPIIRDGKPVGTVIEVRDTTEEQRIQREQVRLVSIIEHSSDFIGFASPEGQPLYLNEAGQQLVGLDGIAEVRRHTIPDFFVPKDRAFVEQVILPNAREQGRWEGEFRFRHFKTGQAIPVWYNLFALRDHATGQLLGFATVTRDITERKRAEEALRHQSRLTKTITDNAASCLFMMDHRGYPTFMNPAAEAVTGYTLNEIADQPLHDSIHHQYPDGRPYPIEACPISTISAQLVQLKNQEAVFIRKDGTFFPVSFSIMPLVQDGNTVGAVLEFQDITERKQLEQRRDQFLSVASHELKTPITAIKAFCELLQKRAGQREVSERELRTLDILNTQADRLTRLVNEMLDVSRLMTGKFEIVFEEVDIGRFVHDIVDHWHLVYTSHRFTVEAAQACTVEANPDRLQQVVLNLLTNAVQHAPAQSTIHIRVTEDHQRVTVALQDAGPGIPKEKQPFLFDRFYQAQDHPARGMGLGLYIAKEIIERHHGTIWVESNVGQGSTFFFALPCKR